MSKRSSKKPDWNALMKALVPQIDEVPKGFKTRDAWADELGVAKTTMGDRLNLGVKSGSVEKRTFNVKAGKSGLRALSHYRPVVK